MRTRLAIALLVGCSAHGSGGVTVTVTGTEGKPIPANGALDILLVDASVNGVAGTLVVDTGSPIVALDPSAFMGASVPDGVGTVGTLSLGGLSIAKPSVVGADLLSSPDPTIAVDGSLGCAVLCAFVVSLDYRASTVTLGTSAPPGNVAGAASVPFSLAGGGDMSFDGVPGTVDAPASRIVLSTTVEGQQHAFILDTGSGTVAIRQTMFANLVSDGRGHLAGITTAGMGSSASASVTRLRSLAVGGQEVDGLVAAADASLDAALDGLSSEVGQTIDGLIGGSFLRSFYVTVDYTASTLSLRKYTEGAPTYDVYDRLGVAIAPAGEGTGNGAREATVAQVFAGTAAAKDGVVVGDVVVAVDGHTLATLGPTAIDALLSGPVGSTKTVQFGAAGSSSLSMHTVSIAVDDILAL